MAEYLGTKPDENFYIDNYTKYKETIDLVNDGYCENYFVALKFTALFDYDVLKKSNLF